MPVTRSSLKKSRIINSVYGQIVIVCLAFTVMVVSSYLFVGKIMRSHLTNETETALNLMRDSIESDLLEPEMLMLSISQTVRNNIQQGYDSDRVREYIEDISANVIRKEKRKMAVNGLYGYFDVFGEFINDGLWKPPENFVARERPW
jgi:hypothetical protein